MALSVTFVGPEVSFKASTDYNSIEVDASAYSRCTVDCWTISIAGGGASVTFYLEGRTDASASYRALANSGAVTATGHNYIDFYAAATSGPATIGLARIRVSPNASITGLTVRVSATFA